MFSDLKDPSLHKTVFDGLVSILGQSRVSVESLDIEKHAQVLLKTTDRQDPFNIIAFPSNTEQISEIVKLAESNNVPIVAYGGGTSFQGHTSAPYGGICIDMMYMDKILEFHPSDLEVTVEAGVEWTYLNSQLKAKNLFFPVDPFIGAKIGGMIATGCSGTNAARYGSIKDGWVLSLTVVLADGSIIKTKSGTKKNSSGYDINRLFIGSEGTLGIITQATLKLANLAKFQRVVVCAFETIDDAVEAASQIVRHDIDFKNIEYVDGNYMRQPTESYEFDPDPKPNVYVLHQGSSEETLRKDQEKLRKVFSNGSNLIFSETDAETETFIMRRKMLSIAYAKMVMKLKPRIFHITDVCVPVRNISALIKFHSNDLKKRGLYRGLAGHLGDGNIHSAIFYDKADPNETKSANECHEALLLKALELGGTMSGEHGIGMDKKKYLEVEYGGIMIGIMKGVKKVFDPRGILNPGKIFD